MARSINEIIENGTLPENFLDLLPLISNNDGTYLNQEGINWDFKETWPFSYSDEYFGGIARLFCAFANTEGGIIIFGVHDETRKGGKTKITPNSDRFEQALSQLTGITPKFEVRRYQNAEYGDVDIMLVSRKDPEQSPLRFLQSIKSYPAQTIFIRHGSQVENATVKDISTLYLRGRDNSDHQPPIGLLPPSPATVREFVGRMDAIDRLFAWLATPDEPRAFLYGKGGSGKSTIAYQVFKSIKLDGAGYKIANFPLEKMIYISAKSRYLNVETHEVNRFIGEDFRDETELYQAILSLGDHDLDNEKSNDISYLKSELLKYFDSNSSLIVIDDIDTLSTLGKETGMDFMLGCLWRSKKPSKIIYTLRNRPTQSISNSIEVPGLYGDDLRQFVSICCSQFRVEKPSSSALENLIFPKSEGRPLVVESIIALRRTTGNYPDAIKLFESGPGDNVRDYVFRREWDSLDRTDRGREILTVIAEYGKPISFEDICTISKLDPSRVKDALDSVQEIFLNREESGDQMLYSIGSLTKDFVREAAKSLDYHGNICARVKNFKHTFYADNPSISAYQSRLSRAISRQKTGDSQLLRQLIADMDREAIPSVMEDPRFLWLRGFSRLMSGQHELSRARADFTAALDLNFSPPEDQVLAWFRAESSGDSSDAMTAAILQRVQLSKGYNPAFKTRIKFDRACYLYSRGRVIQSTDPYQAASHLGEALSLHLEAHRELSNQDSSLLSRSEEYTRNTCYSLIQHYARSSDPEQTISVIRQILSDKRLFVDQLAEPMFYFARIVIFNATHKKDILQRRFSKFESMIKDFFEPQRWSDKNLMAEFNSSFQDTKQRFKFMISNLK